MILPDVMCRASWHQFQILTKRSERLLSLGVTTKTTYEIKRVDSDWFAEE